MSLLRVRRNSTSTVAIKGRREKLQFDKSKKCIFAELTKMFESREEQGCVAHLLVSATVAFVVAVLVTLLMH